MDIRPVGASLIHVGRERDGWMDGHVEAAFFVTVQMLLRRLQKVLGGEH
jgi:hypothetical protein